MTTGEVLKEYKIEFLKTTQNFKTITFKNGRFLDNINRLTRGGMLCAGGFIPGA
jgi:hypothetical protein